MILIAIHLMCAMASPVHAEGHSMQALVVSPEFERFDFTQYQEKDGIATTTTHTLSDGSAAEYQRVGEEYFTRITPKDSYFSIEKHFYLDGKIKEKGLKDIEQFFRKGIWYSFKKDGSLGKKTNYDEAYPFSFEKLMDYLVKEKIYLFPRRPRAPLIQRAITPSGPRWCVRILKEKWIEVRTIDGKTGEVLKTEKENYMRI